jgi:hypothetical protein
LTLCTAVVLRCRSFAHDQEPLEVSEVLFERDDKRGSDTLYAAGWNAKVSGSWQGALLVSCCSLPRFLKHCRVMCNRLSVCSRALRTSVLHVSDLAASTVGSHVSCGRVLLHAA